MCVDRVHLAAMDSKKSSTLFDASVELSSEDSARTRAMEYPEITDESDDVDGNERISPISSAVQQLMVKLCEAATRFRPSPYSCMCTDDCY